MLFAVEGGGFFSSSASGYSKGLTLLLLGRRNEEKHMRVTPWNQYQLVGQETDPDLQLASGRNGSVRGCASFACFGRTAAGLDSPSPLKAGPTQNQELLPRCHVLDDTKDPQNLVGCVEDDKISSLKSSLKKAAITAPTPSIGNCGGSVKKIEHERLCEENNDTACQMGRRKVQWTDTTGGDLFEIREFEMSEDGSDDDFDHGNEKTCSCRIM